MWGVSNGWWKKSYTLVFEHTFELKFRRKTLTHLRRISCADKIESENRRIATSDYIISASKPSSKRGVLTGGISNEAFVPAKQIFLFGIAGVGNGGITNGPDGGDLRKVARNRHVGVVDDRTEHVGLVNFIENGEVLYVHYILRESARFILRMYSQSPFFTVKLRHTEHRTLTDPRVSTMERDLENIESRK